MKRQFLELLDKDVEFRYTVAGYLGLSEILKRLDSVEESIKRLWEEVRALREGQAKMWEEIARLREDMRAGFESIHRLVTALGARWGLMSEEAFREGMRAVLEKEFGAKVEKWVARDDEGLVFDRPVIVDVDVVVRDEKVTLIEVRSHVGLSDVSAFARKAKLYEMRTGKKVHRLLIVTPFIDPRALEVAKELGIEVYTKT